MTTRILPTNRDIESFDKDDEAYLEACRRDDLEYVLEHEGEVEFQVEATRDAIKGANDPEQLFQALNGEVCLDFIIRIHVAILTMYRYV